MFSFEEVKKVSVCIPIYNGEKYIAATLDSIINQTYKNIKIIVSDNCSTDNSCKIVEEYMKKDNRISLNKNSQNLGYSGNLNKLIEIANGEYIAIYHADDIYEKSIIEEQVKFLAENRELAGCFTLGNVINENGNRTKNKFPMNEENLKRNLIVDIDFFIKNLTKNNNILICPTSMIKKSVYLEVKGYRENVRIIEDQDMWLRILKKYKIGIIAKALINYRVHNLQGSSYYTDYKREEVSFSVKNLEEFIKENNLEEKYIRNIEEMYAREYCLIVLNKLKAGEKNKCIYFAKESKKYYKYSCFNKKWILQNINIPFIYNVLRLKFRKI